MRELHFIAHSGGAAPDRESSFYSSALSTLEYNYNKGFRIFEIDLLYARDKQRQVCSHGWKNHENNPRLRRFPQDDLSYLYDPDSFPSFNEITESRQDTYQQYSDGCNQETLMLWLQSHEDAELILDMKSWLDEGSQTVQEWKETKADEIDQVG